MNAIFDDSLGIERRAPSQYTSNADEEAELVYRFDQAVHRSTTEAMLALDSAARACGAKMRASGITPERALMAMKDRLRGRSASVWSPSLVENRYATRPPEAEVYRRLFSWWVSGYYECSG